MNRTLGKFPSLNSFYSITFKGKIFEFLPYVIAKFLGRSSDKNEKGVHNKFFTCDGLFFVVEVLKTVKNPLNTILFIKLSIF